MKTIFFIALLATPFSYTMIATRAVQQLTVIKPFFQSRHTLHAIRKIIDDIEIKQLTYPDYSRRTGIMWSDFWVKTQNPEKIEECKDTIKLTEIAGKLQKHHPESIFQYPILKSILCQQILPKTFAFIATNEWAPLPKKVFAQFFLQRCHTSEPMDWHQDPGQDYDTMADFSLVLMLSQQNDSAHGWHGGEFKIRSGLPADTYNEADVTTIIPQCNCAFLFNNKINSHSVTAVTSNVAQSKRDLIVVPIYLEKPPMPL